MLLGLLATLSLAQAPAPELRLTAHLPYDFGRDLMAGGAVKSNSEYEVTFVSIEVHSTAGDTPQDIEVTVELPGKNEPHSLVLHGRQGKKGRDLAPFWVDLGWRCGPVAFTVKVGDQTLKKTLKVVCDR
ncbi:MAG: hypothetical protein U0228_04085 [Myxococcaceae bacterium]